MPVCQFVLSACFASMRSVTFSPPPPTQISGSCWIGFAQSYLNTPAGKKMLGLPDSWVPVAPIIVGYPSAPPATVARKKPEVRWVG